MVVGFIKGIIGKPAEKATGLYAWKDKTKNFINRLPFVGTIYRTSKVIGTIIILIILFIIYRIVK